MGSSLFGWLFFSTRRLLEISIQKGGKAQITGLGSNAIEYPFTSLKSADGAL
jgi:hypothetical protein